MPLWLLVYKLSTEARYFHSFGHMPRREFAGSKGDSLHAVRKGVLCVIVFVLDNINHRTIISTIHSYAWYFSHSSELLLGRKCQARWRFQCAGIKWGHMTNSCQKSLNFRIMIVRKWLCLWFVHLSSARGWWEQRFWIQSSGGIICEDSSIEIYLLVKTFSHSVGCCFAWVMAFFFFCAEAFQLSESHLIVVPSACSLVFCSGSHFMCQWVSKIFPTFSFIRVRVSGLLLRYLIPLELNFLQGERYRSIFVLLHPPIQFGQHNLLKMLSFVQCGFLVLCQKLGACRYVYLFLNYHFDWFFHE